MFEFASSSRQVPYLKRDRSPKLILFLQAKLSIAGNSNILNILRMSTLPLQIMSIPFQPVASIIIEQIFRFWLSVCHSRRQCALSSLHRRIQNAVFKDVFSYNMTTQYVVLNSSCLTQVSQLSEGIQILLSKISNQVVAMQPIIFFL